MKSLIVVGIAMALTTAAWAQATNKATAGNADEKFVMNTAKGGMAEVELGKLAVTKASKDEVKKFGQMMVDDHSKASDELKAVAQQKNISWPTEIDVKEKALRDRLSKLSGEAFDRAYMDAMVNGHRKVANEFKVEVRAGKDADVKAWAGKTLPTVEAHLKHAEELNRTVSTATH